MRFRSSGARVMTLLKQLSRLCQIRRQQARLRQRTRELGRWTPERPPNSQAHLRNFPSHAALIVKSYHEHVETIMDLHSHILEIQLMPCHTFVLIKTYIVTSEGTARFNRNCLRGGYRSGTFLHLCHVAASREVAAFCRGWVQQGIGVGANMPCLWLPAIMFVSGYDCLLLYRSALLRHWMVG